MGLILDFTSRVLRSIAVMLGMTLLLFGAALGTAYEPFRLTLGLSVTDLDTLTMLGLLAGMLLVVATLVVRFDLIRNFGGWRSDVDDVMLIGGTVLSMTTGVIGVLVIIQSNNPGMVDPIGLAIATSVALMCSGMVGITNLAPSK
jgi:hypothetical protein